MGGEVGQVQQGLKGGDVVGGADQERLGLIGVTTPGGYSSGVLLSRDWALIAGHAAGPLNEDNTPIKDSDYPQGYRTWPAQQVKVTAGWGNGQTRAATAVTMLGLADAALLKLDAPIQCSSLPPGVRRAIGTSEVANVFLGDWRQLTLFGRGMHDDTGELDGQWRTGFAFVTSEDVAKRRIYYTSLTGDKQAAGDSGGPIFTGPPGNQELVALIAGYDQTGQYGAPLKYSLSFINQVVTEGTAEPAKVFTGKFASGGPGEDADAIAEFRGAAAWAVASAAPGEPFQFDTGIPTMRHYTRGLSHFTDRWRVLRGKFDWRWVPAAELGLADPNNFRESMRTAHNYAVAHGFAGALPSFSSIDFGEGIRHGLWLVPEQLGELRSVSLEDLQLPPLPKFGKRHEFPIADLVKAAVRYSFWAPGFNGGWPTMDVGVRWFFGNVGEKVKTRDAADIVLLRTAGTTEYKTDIHQFDDPR